MFQKGCCHDIGRENGMLASWTVFPWPSRCITLLKQPVFTKRHFQTKETSVKLPWAMARLRVRNCAPLLEVKKSRNNQQASENLPWNLALPRLGIKSPWIIWVICWESQSSKFYKTILRNYTGMGQNLYLYNHHTWGNNHPLPRVSGFWLTGHMIQMLECFHAPNIWNGIEAVSKNGVGNRSSTGGIAGLDVSTMRITCWAVCSERMWMGERLKESIPNVKHQPPLRLDFTPTLSHLMSIFAQLMDQ